MRLFVCCALALFVSACGGSSETPETNAEPNASHFAVAVVGGKRQEFSTLLCIRGKEQGSFAVQFVTDDPDPVVTETDGSVTVVLPPEVSLNMKLTSMTDGFTKENIESMDLIISNLPESDDIVWKRNVMEFIKSISGKTSYGAKFEIEFEWSEGEDSFSANVSGKFN